MLGCTNAHWPDIHGHYREAKFTQVLLKNIFISAFTASGKDSYNFHIFFPQSTPDKTQLIVENIPMSFTFFTFDLSYSYSIHPNTTGGFTFTVDSFKSYFYPQTKHN